MFGVILSKHFKIDGVTSPAPSFVSYTAAARIHFPNEVRVYLMLHLSLA